MSIIARAVEKRRLVLENQQLLANLQQENGPVLIGRSPQMQQLRKMLLNVADTGADISYLWGQRYLLCQRFLLCQDLFLYIETQLKIAKDFCRPGEEVSSSIASTVFHAFIDLVNKMKKKKKKKKNQG